MAVRKPLVLIAGVQQELPAGDTTPAVGVPVFAQDTAPTVASGNYIWFQTNYLVAGDTTMWIEDRLP